MEIVRATVGDAQALRQICVEAKAHWGYPADWMARWRELVCISPDYISHNHVYMAVDGTVIIGWYALAAEFPKCLLDHLWVAPPRMGSGVGRLLFDHAIAQALQLGATYLEIESDPNALGFYLRMGARQVGEVEGGMDRNIPLLRHDLASASQSSVSSLSSPVPGAT